MKRLFRPQPYTLSPLDNVTFRAGNWNMGKDISLDADNDAIDDLVMPDGLVFTLTGIKDAVPDTIQVRLVSRNGRHLHVEPL